MRFDTLVIGGGIAGLSCALRCQKAGQKTAVITLGQSAMHFSSGSIDVLNRLPNGELVMKPFAEMHKIKEHIPEHPYVKIGATKVKESLHWFRDEIRNDGMHLESLQNQDDEDINHVRMTPMGMFKATWASQDTVTPFIQQNPAHGFSHITLLTFEGFRDFQTELASANLKAMPHFKDVEVECVAVELEEFKHFARNPCEFRSVDISNILQDSNVLNSLAQKMIAQVNKSTDLIIMPAVFRGKEGRARIKLLEKLIEHNICEMPTTPPSLIGIRIEDSLKQLYKNLGGQILDGDEVKKGDFKDGTLHAIYTKNYNDFPMQADNYVLASGSFFSHGLRANKTDFYESTFGLDVESESPRTKWYSYSFFAKEGHPFMAFGVKTDPKFRPYYQGKLINNLYCAGAILANYHPVVEGSGSGVAISTGYQAAENILNQEDRG